MSQYGITAEMKVVFHSDGDRYERLADAVNHARTQQAPSRKDDTSHDTDDPTATTWKTYRRPTQAHSPTRTGMVPRILIWERGSHCRA